MFFFNSKYPTRLSETVPDMVEVIANSSMRLALGGVGTGSSWHIHGPAMLAIAAGYYFTHIDIFFNKYSIDQ